TVEAWQERRGYHIANAECGSELEPGRAKDLNRLSLGIKNPIFFHAVLFVELPLCVLVAAPVLGSRRENFDNQFRRAGYSISSRYFFAAFVADVHEVGDDSAEVAEDHAGSRQDLSNRVVAKILLEEKVHIPD